MSHYGHGVWISTTSSVAAKAPGPLHTGEARAVRSKFSQSVATPPAISAGAESTARWASVVPDGFVFHVKLFGVFCGVGVPLNALPRTVREMPCMAAIVARGQEVYKTSCAACHGDRLQGQENWRQRDVDGLLPAPPHDASGHTWHHPDAVLFALTKYGPQGVVGGEYRSAMPGFEDVLSDADILAALSYIKSTWPAENRARHDDINAQYDAETR